MTRALQALVLVLLVGCAPSWKQAPHDVPYQAAAAPVLHRLPPAQPQSSWAEIGRAGAVLPIARAVSPEQVYLTLRGGRTALDINAFGKVPDSTWFQNRLGRRALDRAAIQRGPNRSDGPADGPLVVLRGNFEGPTPRLVVRDAAGTLWIVKFDPPAFPEMSTGAEMIATRLMWAAGYWVPETHLADVHVERFTVAEEAVAVTERHEEVRLSERALSVLLQNLNPDLARRLRVLFSRHVPGVPLGPFGYRGFRWSDPNDRIVHERRRSLRGKWVFSAWINNTDVRAHNTLDTFIPVTEDGRGYVRHYLLDFDHSLGAAGGHDKYFGAGYEHIFEWSAIGRRIISFGLVYPYWQWGRRSPYRTIGFFEAQVFAPGRWRPEVPNPAYLEAQLEDTFWAAGILAHFDRERVEAAVETARYSQPGVAAYVVEVLLARRDKLLRYAFEPLAPLDEPRVRGGYEVELTDLEEVAGLLDQPVQYRWSVAWHRTGAPDRALGSGTATAPRFDLRAAVREVMGRWEREFRADPYLTLTIHRVRGDAAGPAVRVHLRAVRDTLLPVAVERDRR